MNAKLTFKQKLAWQAVGFVIGAVMFVLAGGLSGCATTPRVPDCPTAHATWMSRAHALNVCMEMVGCQYDAEHVRQERLAHAQMMAVCPVEKQK